MDDVLIASNALDQGVKVRALSQYYTKHYSTRQKGLLLGFACVREQEISGGFWCVTQMSAKCRSSYAELIIFIN